MSEQCYNSTITNKSFNYFNPSEISPPNFDENSKNNAKNTKIVEVYPPNSDEISKNNAKTQKFYKFIMNFI